MATPPLLKLGYWNIRGLAAPLRMMLCFRQIPFENTTYRLDGRFDRSVWLQHAKPAILEKNPLANLPYIIDGEIVVTQSNACLSYLGRKLDLWGHNEVEIIQCEQLLCEAMDLRNLVVSFCYGRSGDPTELQQVKDFISMVQSGILAKFNDWLSRNTVFDQSSPFFVGQHATAPDFHIYELIDQLNLLAKFNGLPLVTFQQLPHLDAFYHAFSDHPCNKKYFSSLLSKAPCNNLTAVFGSTSDGSRWTEALPLPDDVSGIY